MCPAGCGVYDGTLAYTCALQELEGLRMSQLKTHACTYVLVTQPGHTCIPCYEQLAWQPTHLPNTHTASLSLHLCLQLPSIIRHWLHPDRCADVLWLILDIKHDAPALPGASESTCHASVLLCQAGNAPENECSAPQCVQHPAKQERKVPGEMPADRWQREW